MALSHFHLLLWGMAVLGLIVFIALYYIEAGYGMLFNKRWGVSISNKAAWVLMESPVFIIMTIMWYLSPRRAEIAPIIIFLLFQTHYFQRAFIFPLLLKGRSKMPVAIALMGVMFNVINGFIQGEWIFYLSPASLYTRDWLTSPYFIIGTAIFFTGMIINIHSDYTIRHLRKPGDTNHYLPQKGLFRYVTSANYMGELIEWTGFAILTWSASGWLFVWWTFANLVPRSNAIYMHYRQMFGSEALKNRKRIIPFIY